MRTIKNVTDHVDELHDGRPIPAFESVQITDADFKKGKDHYEQRIADGAFLLVSEDPDPDPDPDPDSNSDGPDAQADTQADPAKTTSRRTTSRQTITTQEGKS